MCHALAGQQLRLIVFAMIFSSRPTAAAYWLSGRREVVLHRMHGFIERGMCACSVP